MKKLILLILLGIAGLTNAAEIDPYYEQAAQAAIHRIPSASEAAEEAANMAQGYLDDTTINEDTPLGMMKIALIRALKNGESSDAARKIGQNIFWDVIKPYLEKEGLKDRVEISNLYFDWNVEIQKVLIKNIDFILKDKVVLNSPSFMRNLKPLYDSGIGLDAARIQAYEKTKQELDR